MEPRSAQPLDPTFVATVPTVPTELYAAALKERDTYRKAYEALLLEVERLRRSLFGRKAERVDQGQLALDFAEFAAKLAELETLAAAAPAPDASEMAPEGSPPSDPKAKRRGASKPSGRRDVAQADLPEETIRLEPPVDLPEHKKPVRFESSYRVEWRKGHYVRLHLLRPIYSIDATDEEAAVSGVTTKLVVADMPHEMIPGGLAGPALLAHVLVSKFADHLPFHRQESILARTGFELDRGTMCRWAKSCHELAERVVGAMEKEALATAFVIATDATGVLVQQSERCKRGHFWAFIADREHVFFKYSARHSHHEPLTFFKGFDGYVQADASSVYDALYKKPDGPTEVGCWSHARRKFFEAIRSARAPAHVAVGFIDQLFEVDRKARRLSPKQRFELRAARAAPVLEMFKTWIAEQLALPHLEPRSPLARALRYVDRHWDALTRFLDDGRLRLDNNPSELELRRLVLGRKNWLFVGSDDTAPITCTFVSLIASCALHGLDPEAYLRDLFRLLPAWPAPRLIELAPKYWTRTRARLDASELAMSLGPLTIPPPEKAAAQPDAA